jgi:Tfp pilus assembly protein PilX
MGERKLRNKRRDRESGMALLIALLALLLVSAIGMGMM